MSEMGFWDHLTLALSLAVIVIYLAVRIRRLFSPNDRDCSGCNIHNGADGCPQDPKSNCTVKSATIEHSTQQQRSDP